MLLWRYVFLIVLMTELAEGSPLEAELGLLSCCSSRVVWQGKFSSRQCSLRL